jgi:hypothetical protein
MADNNPLTADMILRMQQQSSAALKKIDDNIWVEADTTPPAEVVEVLVTSDHPQAQTMLQQAQTAEPKERSTGVPEDPA